MDKWLPYKSGPVPWEIPAHMGKKKLPVIPQTVNEDTKLDELNLNWKVVDLPIRERSRHIYGLYPYLDNFVPQLVEVFLRKYMKKGQTVLDLFSGSGTTLVQANELGINSVGYDVSAFNVLLTKVKTTKYNVDEVRKETIDILNKTKKLALKRVVNNNSDNEYLNTWFSPNALHELITYRDLISSEGYENSCLLKIILCRAARSARLVKYSDQYFPKSPQAKPYKRHSHSKIRSLTETALRPLNRYSVGTVRRIEQFSLVRTDATVDVHHADSRDVSFPFVDGVITGPPYMGLINYHEQNIYAYNLLGLTDNRTSEIGWSIKGRGSVYMDNYKEAMATVFSNTLNSMKSGGPLIVIAHDVHNLYQDIADSIGVETEGIVKRPASNKKNRLNGKHYESIFIWRKV